MPNLTGGYQSAYYPNGYRGESEVKPCCAKCRRGIKGFGVLPCGYLGECPNECHREKGGSDA